MGNIKINYKKIVSKKKFSFDNATRYDVGVDVGLNSEQVAERQKNGYVNYTPNNNTKTYANIFFSNIFTFFNLLTFSVAIALMVVGAWDNLFFMVVIFANLLIGIIQEIRAKRTIEKISFVTSPTATVIRNGEKIVIKTNEIVLDDVGELKIGDQVCADAIILNGCVEVNESQLTGESKSIKKGMGDSLFSGSFITSGSCWVKFDKVGSACYISTLAIKAKRYKKADSQLLNSLRLIIKCIGFIIVPLGILIFYNNNTISSEISEVITKTAGSVIGMIPAGMFLLTSLALAVGVIKLSAKKTLVQDLYSIEALSRINVLCFDKTGTLTDGTMKVDDIISFDEKFDTKKVLSEYLYNFKTTNQTSLALVQHFGLKGSVDAKQVFEFNSEHKYSAVNYEKVSYVLGAPDKIVKLDNELKARIDEYSSNGYRVLAFAKSSNKVQQDKLPADLKIMCLIIILDHIRPDAKKTIEWFTQNDVEIKIISGDNPNTVSEISRRCGVPNSEKYINLDGMTDEQVAECANKYTVFGRVSPEQKCILVKTIKALGKKVGMTGDGVNDILALKESDCSIAMASGSQASKNVSNLVLLDSNFASLPSVVAEGRRVVNNISKSASLFLMKTVFTISLTILCLIFNLTYPFIPNQILLLETFAIGVPAFFLALEPSKERIKGNFLKNILLRAVPGGLIYVINFIACLLYVQFTLNGGALANHALYETMASISVTFTGMLILFKVCIPFNWLKGLMYALCFIAVMVLILVLPITFFDYILLDHARLLYCLIVILASIPFVTLFIPNPNKRLFEKDQKNNHEKDNV